MTIDVIDVLGFFGTLLNIWGNALLNYQRAGGFWVRLLCNLVWITHACLRPNVAVLANAVIFLFMNAHGIWKWRRIARQRAVANVVMFQVGADEARRRERRRSRRST